MYREIDKCRLCGNSHLDPIVDLGTMHLTGMFPKSPDEVVPRGPLTLVKCNKHSMPGACGLAQLQHSFDARVLYNKRYGYRSSLNQSMIDHLRDIKTALTNRIHLNDDIVVDIGSNDGTLLNIYTNQTVQRVGIDPIANYLHHYYRKDSVIIADFFTAHAYRKHLGNKKARIVTSIAMLYDIDDPLCFAQDIYDILDNDGIWVFEVAYLPCILERTAYDSICHEHCAYYALEQIIWLTDHAGFNIIDIVLNDINGGSILVTTAKKGSKAYVRNNAIDSLLNEEKKRNLNEHEIYGRFMDCVTRHKDILRDEITRIHMKDKTIAGYGASTKGNVILQHCELSPRLIPYIMEINKDKVGCYTPGTNIPIIFEQDTAMQKPDYLLALPWHFKKYFIEKEQNFLSRGGRFLFPLPYVHIA